MKARGLGRGLSALIPEATVEAGETAREVPVERLRPNPHQPRRHLDEEALEELTRSVEEHGVLEPLVVRPAGDVYEIVAGERRWRAAQRAGLKRVPVVVREVPDERMLEIALVENLVREDLGLWEEAQALRELMRLQGLTQEEVGQRVGKSRSHVANTLRVLSLPEGAARLVQEGRLTLGQVKAILEAPPGEVEALAAQVAQEGLTVQEIQRRVSRMRQGKPLSKGEEEGAAWPEEARGAVRVVEDRLGRPLVWRKRRQGGEIVIRCRSAQDAADVLRKLGAVL